MDAILRAPRVGLNRLERCRHLIIIVPPGFPRYYWALRHERSLASDSLFDFARRWPRIAAISSCFSLLASPFPPPFTLSLFSDRLLAARASSEGLTFNSKKFPFLHREKKKKEKYLGIRVR
ncbi:hypothetical protein P170DRAFT_433825, partial [Aspergillus steynii IBT 23096]